MYDIFAAILLADHLSRHKQDQHRYDPQPEPESPWARIFAWYRRK